MASLLPRELLDAVMDHLVDSVSRARLKLQPHLYAALL